MRLTILFFACAALACAQSNSLELCDQATPVRHCTTITVSAAGPLTLTGLSSGNGNIFLSPGSGGGGNNSVVINANVSSQPGLKVKTATGGTTTGTAFSLIDSSSVAHVWAMQAGDATYPNGLFTEGLYPHADNTYNLGDATHRYNARFNNVTIDGTCTGCSGGVSWPLVVPGGTAAPQFDATGLGAALNINGSSTTNGNIVMNPGGATSGSGSLVVNQGRVDQPALYLVEHSGTTTAPTFTKRDSGNVARFWILGHTDAGCPDCVISTGAKLYVGTSTDDSSGGAIQTPGFVSAVTGYYSAGTASNTLNIPAGGGTALNFTGGTSSAGGTAFFGQNNSGANATIYAKNFNASGPGIQDDSTHGLISNGDIYVNNGGSGRVHLGSTEWQPATDNTVSLGDSSNRFKDGYFSGTLSMQGADNYVNGSGAANSAILHIQNGGRMIFEGTGTGGTTLEMKSGAIMLLQPGSVFSGNVIPGSSNSYDLGSASAAFKDLYLGGFVKRYANVPTAGYGVPPIVVSTSVGGQTTSGSFTNFLDGNGSNLAAGTYEVSFFIQFSNNASSGSNVRPVIQMSFGTNSEVMEVVTSVLGTPGVNASSAANFGYSFGSAVVHYDGTSTGGGVKIGYTYTVSGTNPMTTGSFTIYVVVKAIN